MGSLMETLRPADIRDLPILLDRLMPQYYAHDHLPFSREKLEPALRRLMSERELGRLWMIEDERAAVIGYVALVFCFSLECFGREAYVDELFVLPERRGSGVGSRVLREVIRRCPELEIRLLRLEVTRHNERAKDLYLRLGFQDHGRSALLYPDPS